MGTSVFVVNDRLATLLQLSEELKSQADLDLIGVSGQLPEPSAVATGAKLDLVLLYHDVGGEDPRTSISKVRSVHPSAAILLVSAGSAAEAMDVALDTQINGFVHVSEGTDAITKAVRLVARGEAAFSTDHLLEAARRAREATLAPPLTARERQVLQMLAGGATATAIASELVLSTHTVRNHVRHILNKLGAHSQLEAVSMALRIGAIDSP